MRILENGLGYMNYNQTRYEIKKSAGKWRIRFGLISQK